MNELLKKHDTIDMVDLKGREVEIDCGIAGLIQLVWDAGISTEFSCEGDGYGDTFYISFTDRDDLAKFLAIVGRSDFEYYSVLINAISVTYSRLRMYYENKWGYQIHVRHYKDDCYVNQASVYMSDIYMDMVVEKFHRDIWHQVQNCC